ncbi:MAG: methyltransferase domain-containing protein [Acidobacteriota bacterium]|nr:methyltransferase domain-containing protein [Acidobacteriota bacterium]
MTEGAKNTAGDVYVLGTGAAAAARLRLLDEVYGGTTRQMLLDAGLKPGMRVLDLACGVGTVSCWMAGIVGPTGSVVGIDVNPDQLVVARDTWSNCNGIPPVEFLEASAYDTGLPAGSFDLIHTRFLLCHLTEPAGVLAEMYRLLKPGGAVVCHDIHISSIFAHPPSDAYARSVELGHAVGKALGVNYDFGLELAGELTRAGFRQPAVKLDHPAYLSGEGKRLWEMTFAEAVPVMAREGVASPEELAEVVRDMAALAEREDVLLGSWRMMGVRAVK